MRDAEIGLLAAHCIVDYDDDRMGAVRLGAPPRLDQNSLVSSKFETYHVRIAL